MWFTLAAAVSLVVLLVVSFAPQLLYAGASLRYSLPTDAAASADSESRRSRRSRRSQRSGRVHWRSARTLRRRGIADA